MGDVRPMMEGLLPGWEFDRLRVIWGEDEEEFADFETA
jgi:hypothetical protein